MSVPPVLPGQHLYALDPIPETGAAAQSLQIFDPPEHASSDQPAISPPSTFDRMSALFKHVLAATDQLDNLSVAQRSRVDISTLPSDVIGVKTPPNHLETGKPLWDSPTVFIRMMQYGDNNRKTRFIDEASAAVNGGMHGSAGIYSKQVKKGLSATLIGPGLDEPFDGDVGIVFRGETVGLVGYKGSIKSNGLLGTPEYQKAIINREPGCLEQLCKIIIDLKENDDFNKARVQPLRQVAVFEHIEVYLRHVGRLPDDNSRVLLINLLEKYQVPGFNPKDLSALRDLTALNDLKKALIGKLREHNQTDEYIGVFLALHKMHGKTVDEQVAYLEKGLKKNPYSFSFRKKYASQGITLRNEHLILPKERKESEKSDALGIFIRDPQDPHHLELARDLYNDLNFAIKRYHEVIFEIEESEHPSTSQRELYFVTRDQEKQWQHVLTKDVIEEKAQQ